MLSKQYLKVIYSNFNQINVHLQLWPFDCNVHCVGLDGGQIELNILKTVL